MEFAMYGSLKDYLKSVKNGKLPNPQLLLNQQQVLLGQAPLPHSPQTPQVPNGNANAPLEGVGSEMMSVAYPTTNQQSSLSLCPYHHSQLAQFINVSSPARIGAASDNLSYQPTGRGAQATEESVSLYDMDPASKAHATRLLRLLNSDYCLQQMTDEHDCCHGNAEVGATMTSGQSAYSYRRLGERCVRRACLDDYPYWYGSLPRNNYYNSYYNYSEQRREPSESPLADTPGTNAPLLPPPPIYVNSYKGDGDAISGNDPHQECMYDQQSPNTLTPYHNLSASNTCVYCCQCVGGDAVGTQRLGIGDQSSVGGAVNTSSEAEVGLSYFEVLDFAQQIARGMEHLEKMKVSVTSSLSL